MDTADAIGFCGAGDAEKRAAETRSRAFGAKGVVRAFAFLYPLSLVGRLVKRKVCGVAHRVADRAADRVAERAARILRDERVAEELAERAETAARADPGDALEDAEEDAEENHRGEKTPVFSNVANGIATHQKDAERAGAEEAFFAASGASAADVALQCEMEEGAPQTRLVETRPKPTLEARRGEPRGENEASLGASPAAPEKATNAKARKSGESGQSGQSGASRAALSAPPGWAFVSEDGE